MQNPTLRDRASRARGRRESNGRLCRTSTRAHYRLEGQPTTLPRQPCSSSQRAPKGPPQLGSTPRRQAHQPAQDRTRVQMVRVEDRKPPKTSHRSRRCPSARKVRRPRSIYVEQPGGAARAGSHRRSTRSHHWLERQPSSPLNLPHGSCTRGNSFQALDVKELRLPNEPETDRFAWGIEELCLSFQIVDGVGR